MIEVENTDLNIVINFIQMRNHMPASAYGLKAISDWLFLICSMNLPFDWFSVLSTFVPEYVQLSSSFGLPYFLLTFD